MKALLKLRALAALAALGAAGAQAQPTTYYVNALPAVNVGFDGNTTMTTLVDVAVTGGSSAVNLAMTNTTAPTGTTRWRLREGANDTRVGQEYFRAYTPAFAAGATFAANATAYADFYLATATGSCTAWATLYEYSDTNGVVGAAKGTASTACSLVTTRQAINNVSFGNAQFSVAAGNRLMVVYGFDMSVSRPTYLWGQASSTTPSGFQSFTVTTAAAVNGTGAGAVSAAASGCTGLAVNAPYTNDSNGNNTLSYRYRTPSGTGAWSTTFNRAHSASPYAFTVAGLTWNAGYDVEVTYADADGVTGTAVQTVTNVLVGPNCTGAGTFSAAATPGATPSLALSGPYTGDANANNTASYRYRVSPAGAWVGPTALTHAASPYAATLGGLTCGTAYDVELTWTDADGLGSGTAVQTVTVTPTTCLTAAAPTAVADSCSQVTAAAAFSNNSNGDGSTAFDRGPSATGPWTAVTGCSAVTGATPRTCVDTGVAATTTYYYRATVTDPDGIAGTNPAVSAAVTTPSCSAPQVTPGVPAATATSCSQVNLTAPFTGDTNANSTTTFSWGTSATGPWTAACSAVVGASPRACGVTGLANATAFYFKVDFADADGVTGSASQLVGPTSTFDCRVAPGAVSGVANSCSQVTASATHAGDLDGNSTSAFARGPTATGPWTAVAGCGALTGASPRACVDTGVAAASSVYYQVTYADVAGVNGANPIVSAAVSVPACAAVLTVSSGAGQPLGGNVAQGSVGAVVGKLQLSAGAGTITLSSLQVSNTGTAVFGADVAALLLYDDANANGVVDAGEALLAVAASSGGKYVFSGLSYALTSPTARQVLLTANVAPGAAAGRTFAMQVAQADVAVNAPNTVAATNLPLTGNLFTVSAGAWVEGDPTANSTRPMAVVLNPSSGARVSSDGPAGTVGFRVQAQVYSPTALTSVTLSTDTGTTFPTALAKNANYGGGANDGIWETSVKLAPGSYVLVVRATNASGSVDSGRVQIVVNARGVGDGNLLVRDNSSELCLDCHALKSHSSQSTSTKYGSWATACRDCHTPHSTTNIYLVKQQITPPAVNGVQPAKAVKFSATTGATASTLATAQSFANEADNSGPCQVCHTRTQSSTALARWRNTGNADTHYTSTVGTQPCTSCHSHAGGFAAGESGGATDCTNCHNAIFSPMNASTGNTHHHYQYQGWSGTTAGSGLTVYPTAAPTSSLTDVNRRCLMCHVDHNIFRPDLNASGGRGKNLRTDITAAPTATTNFSNTDFDPALPNGGLCVSCHQGSLTRAYTTTAGTTTTLAIAKADFQAGSHNFATNPSSTFSGTGTGTFLANCSKCHNDTLAKSYQSSAAPLRFSLHDSTLRTMPAPLGVTAPTDPLEEQVCYQCHRRATDALTGSTAKPAAQRDYYNAVPMSPTSELIYNVFNAATYPFDHPLATSGIHKATGEGAAAGDGTLSGANRHVSCADCHNPHGAKDASAAAGSVTAFTTGTAPAMDTLTDSARAWTANQWRGYSVRVLSGTGAGQESAVYGNTATALSVEFSTALGVGATYVIVNEGRSAGAVTWTAPTGPITGAWALAPTWPAQPAPPNWNDSAGCGAVGTAGACASITTQFAAITTWNPAPTPAVQGQLCIKCHSAYAYGATPPNTPSAQPNSTASTWSNTVSAAAMVQGDKANEFNPNNLGHHAVFARGRNQPVQANYGQTGLTAVVNTNWPKYSTATAGDTVAIAAGTATFAGAAALPNTALPGWYLFVGSDTLPVTTPAAGTATTGFLEITGIASPTSFTVRACADATCSTSTSAITIAATANWAVTAGLGNAFVPPWGPWSILQCTDCHSSDATTDPYGPHGSSTKWLLRKGVATQTFAFFNGTAVTQVSNTTTDANNLCLNCHRRDCYGDYNFVPGTTGAGLYPRQQHPPDSGDQSSTQKKPKWGIICMNCHGGARVGGIHGENLGRGVNGTAGSYSGKRLLAGATWYGVTRSTTTAAGACWTKGTADAVDNCSHAHSGTSMQSGVAKYDYDTNP